MPKVMTANLLRTGDVVYLAADGQWINDLTQAAVAHVQDDEAALTAIAEDAVRTDLVVSAYLFEVVISDGRPAATSVRERIRAALSPSVRVTASAPHPSHDGATHVSL